MCPHFRDSPDRLCVLISGLVRTGSGWLAKFNDLFLDLLEAIQHRDTRDAVNLTQRDQTDRVETLFPCYLSKVDDCTGSMVYDHHRLTIL